MPAFQVAPPPFATPTEIRPRARWYWIAAGVGLVGGVLGIVLIVVSALRFVDKIEDFQRVAVPATETIHLEAGSYTVYFEGGFVGESDSWSFAGDVVIRDSAERIVELRPYGSRTTYDVSDFAGVAVRTFRVDETGDYRVTTTGAPGTLVAIGPGIGAGFFAGIGIGLLLIVGCGLFAIITVIVVAVRRGSARRRQVADAFGGLRR
jgi:hypothetical protein